MSVEGRLSAKQTTTWGSLRFTEDVGLGQPHGTLNGYHGGVLG